MPGCGGARGAAAVPAKTGGVEWWQWGRALLITSTARAARAYRNSRLQLRARILAGKSLGFRRDKGPRVCGRRGNCGADAGAGRCWPAGHGAGGGVAAQADRRGLGLSAWAPP